MSVSKDKTGKWYAVVKQKNPYSGQTEWKKKRGFSTKREAQAWEADILRTESSSLPEFSIIADEYLKSMDTSINTANQKRAKYRLYFSDYIHTPIDKITKPELQRWRNNLGDQELSTQTKNLTLQYVKAVFLYASKVYGIENNAVMLKTFKKTDAEINCEMQTWSAAEFNQFLSAVDLPVYRLYFEFLYWTGCRRGEALAITKDRISPDGKVVIKESIKHFENGAKSTKNRKIRVIQLDPVLLKDLEPLIKAPGQYLFAGERTLPITNIQREFTNGIRKSKVKKIRLHDLRHSHVSNLIASGVNIVAVANRIGDTVAQVEKTYAHMMKESEDYMNSAITQMHSCMQK